MLEITSSSLDKSRKSASFNGTSDGGAVVDLKQEEVMTSPERELAAMQEVLDLLSGLDEKARLRVYRWAGDRLSITARSSTDGVSSAALKDRGSVFGAIDSLPELFAAARPGSGPLQALVVATWLQFVDGEEQLDPQAVNSSLKDMGYGMKNITAAFTALKNRKPQLVVQTKKGGSTRQARKKFRVTQEGLKEVQRMLANKSDSEGENGY